MFSRCIVESAIFGSLNQRFAAKLKIGFTLFANFVVSFDLELASDS